MLTTNQTAELTGIAEKTLANWRCQGFGPRFAKLGARVVYRKSDVEAWIEANTVASTSEQRAA